MVTVFTIVLEQYTIGYWIEN